MELGDLVAFTQGKPNGGEITAPRIIAPPVVRERLSIPEETWDLPFSELPASVRLLHLAEALDIHRLGDFDGHYPDELMQHGNCGRTTIQDLRTLISRAAAGDFNPTEEDQTNPPLQLLRLLESGLEQLEPDLHSLMMARLGSPTRAPLTLEELGYKRGITREGVRQKVEKACGNIRHYWGPRIPLLFEIIRDRCLSSICPLTPELLTAWIGEPKGLEFPRVTHVRLISLMSDEIPLWSKTFDTRFNESEVNVRLGDAIDELLCRFGPRLTFSDTLERLRQEKAYRRMTAEEFLGRLRRISRMAVDFDDPENPVVRLQRVSANYIALRILEDAEKALPVEEIFARAVARFGADMVRCDARSVANIVGSTPGVHLIDTGLYGLTRHFTLPSAEWRRIRNEYVRLLERENRPVSSYEVVREKRLARIDGVSAHEIASIVRADPRITDLGYLLFALEKWGVEERQLIRELIPKVLEKAGRLLTAQEIGEELRRFRSVSPHTITGIAAKCQGVRDFGYGNFGLEGWGVEKLEPLIEDAKFIERTVSRAEIPLRFGALCNRFGFRPNSKLAQRLWNTCASVDDILKQPDAMATDTVLFHTSARLERAAAAALEFLGRAADPKEIKQALGKLFGTHFGDATLAEIKAALRNNADIDQGDDGKFAPQLKSAE